MPLTSIAPLFLAVALSSAGGAKVDRDVKPLAPMKLQMDLDASGIPSNLHCTDAQPEGMCKMLVRAAGKWKYSPAVKDGAPAATKVEITFDLEAVPHGEGFAVRIASADFFSPEYELDFDKASPPRYPQDMQLHGETGVVTLELALASPDANTLVVKNVWLDGAPVTDKSRNSFVKAAREAAATWTVQPRVAGTRLMAASSCVPVEFTLGRPAAKPKTHICKPQLPAAQKPPELLTEIQGILL